MDLFIADDSQVVLERLIELVGEIPGVSLVGVAKDGITAVDRINYLKPEVIILDIKMPGGNGIDVLRAVRANNPKPVIIMLTNYPLSQYKERCLKLGTDFFFDKSNEFDQIPVVLKSLQTAKKAV
jgi:DNA-binding NarL/FixJ family response regulator